MFVVNFRYTYNEFNDYNGGDQVNSIPEYAESLFNMRTIPAYDNKNSKAYSTV